MNFIYCGNCVNSFDEDGESLIDQFNDVSHFAYVEENCVEINIEDFKKITGCSKSHLEELTKIEDSIFLHNEDEDIFMIYNKEEDIHYFFEKNH